MWMLRTHIACALQIDNFSLFVFINNEYINLFLLSGDFVPL